MPPLPPYAGQHPAQQQPTASQNHDMKTDETYMREAIRQAQQGVEKGNRPYGSVLVNPVGEIVSRAHNTVLETNDPFAHGEINAMRSYCQKIGTIDLAGYTLYATSEPCPMCAAAVGWANISRLVFGSYREDFQKPGYKRQNVRVADYYREQSIDIETTEAVLRNEVIQLYEASSAG
jgi:tRNA(Arg) A34 adenosine deaminase TadA